MDAVIKNRIDMIKRGEVPKKYKKTKVGIIPEVWEVKKLGKIVSKVLDGTHSTPKYTNKGVQFYSVENVTNNDFVNTKYISEQEHNRISKRCPVEKGDILMTRIGSIGDVRIINWDVKASIYVSLALLKFNCKTVRDYFYSYAKSQNFKKAILRNSLLNAIPQKINLGDIEKVNIIIPKNTSEQQKIAQILSIWDNAIELKDNLLKIKEKQKKGLMQNLLTGKIRLPGFSGESINVNLGYLCDIKTGKLDANAMVENGSYRFYTCAEQYFYIDNYDFDTEALLISGNGANVGYIHYYKGKFNAYQRTYVLTNFIENIFYIMYLLEHNLKKRIYNNKNEGNTPYIIKQTLSEMNLKIKVDKEEQQAIANILSTSDKEIDLIKKEIEMLKEQKKGLMQLLLTGIVRVEV